MLTYDVGAARAPPAQEKWRFRVSMLGPRVTETIVAQMQITASDLLNVRDFASFFNSASQGEAPKCLAKSLMTDEPMEDVTFFSPEFVRDLPDEDSGFRSPLFLVSHATGSDKLLLGSDASERLGQVNAQFCAYVWLDRRGDNLKVHLDASVETLDDVWSVLLRAARRTPEMSPAVCPWSVDTMTDAGWDDVDSEPCQWAKLGEELAELEASFEAWPYGYD